MCARENEFKSILFSICYFHAVVCERRKFGPQGWNRVYPYNTGDLTISAMVLYNYLEANAKVPWEDLRYLFGEIMYGGHITDDWDRRLCKTYLEVYMHPDMVSLQVLTFTTCGQFFKGFDLLDYECAVLARGFKLHFQISCFCNTKFLFTDSIELVYF